MVEDQEYLNGINKTIKEMEPVERVSSTVLLALGRVVAELMNLHRWEAVGEMQKVINELFEEANKMKSKTFESMGRPGYGSNN